MSFGDCNGQACPHRPPVLPVPSVSAPRRRRDRVRRLRIGPARQHRIRAEPLNLQPHAREAAGVSASGNEVGREAPQLAAREPGRGRARPRRGRGTLVDRRSQRVRARSASRPSSYGMSSRTCSKRSAKRSAIRSRELVQPFAGRGGDLQRRPGNRLREPAAASSESISVDLVEHDLAGKLIRADLESAPCSRRAVRLLDVVLRTRRRRTTCRTRSETRASPRAWRRSPRPAGAAACG